MKMITIELALFFIILLVLTQVVIPMITGQRLFWLFTKEKPKPFVKVESLEKLKEEANEAVDKYNDAREKVDQVSDELNDIKQNLKS